MMTDTQSRLRDVTRMFADFQLKKKKSSVQGRTIDKDITKTEDAEGAYEDIQASPTPKSKSASTRSSVRSIMKGGVQSEDAQATSTPKSKKQSTRSSARGNLKGETPSGKNKKSQTDSKRKKIPGSNVIKSISRSTYMTVTKAQGCEGAYEGAVQKSASRRKRERSSKRSRFDRTDLGEQTKTEEAYDTKEENLPPQAKYGKDCAEQREYDAMEKETFEVVQNARPATTRLREKELRWKYVEEIFDDEHERERLLLSLRVLSIMNNYKLLEESLKPEEKETLRSYFTSASNDKLNTNIILLIDRSLGCALREMKLHPERFHGEIDENMRRFIKSGRKVKPVLVEAMMMFPENIPESWGGNCYSKNVTARLAEKKTDRRIDDSAKAAKVIVRLERPAVVQSQESTKPEEQGRPKEAQTKGKSAEKEPRLTPLMKTPSPSPEKAEVKETKTIEKGQDKVGKVVPKVVVNQVHQQKLTESKSNEKAIGWKDDGVGEGSKTDKESQKDVEVKKTLSEDDNSEDDEEKPSGVSSETSASKKMKN